MSLVADILKAGVKPAPPAPKQRAEQTVFAEPQRKGYARRKARGSAGLLTWKIPLVQVKNIFLANGIGCTVVWPWLSDDLAIRQHMCVRAHSFLKYYGIKIKTRSKTTGLELTFLAADKSNARRKSKMTRFKA